MKTSSELAAAEAAAQRLFRAGESVLVGVSGGLDSMCLLHFLHARGYAVTAAHFNHRLRGEEADADEGFVRAWCLARDIPCVSGSADVRASAKKSGRSIEEEARLLRYAFLHRAADENCCALIAVAHHMEDNAETVLLNLVRGTGLRGLRGMRERQGRIVRPFLGEHRAALEAYAAAHGIAHVEDRTNQDADAAARNLLRLKVMPLLEELNTGAVDHINAAARDVAGLEPFVEEAAQRCAEQARWEGGELCISRAALRACHEAAQGGAVLALLERLGVPKKDIGRRHLDAVLALVRAGAAGRRADLPYGVHVTRTGDTLRFSVRPAGEAEKKPLRPGEETPWCGYTITLLPKAEREGLTLRATAEELFVGACPVGARLRLTGARGARSVKRLCLDNKIPLSLRDGLPAIYAGERLAAVWGLGADEAFAPDGGETVFLRIERTEI